MLKNVYGFSVLVTAVLVYWLWRWFSAIEFTATDGFIYDFLNEFGRPIILLLSSYTLFMTIQKTLLLLIERVTWIKKLFFNKEYVEGFWVGYVEEQTNPDENYKPRFMIEEFEQTATDICVHGRGYDETGALYVQWSSSNHPTFLKSRDLAFAYTDTFNGKNDEDIRRADGYSRYTLIRSRKGFFRTPIKLDGFIVNHTKVNHIHKMAVLKKIDNPPMLYRKKDKEKGEHDEASGLYGYLFSEAKKLYDSRHENFVDE